MYLEIIYWFVMGVAALMLVERLVRLARRGGSGSVIGTAVFLALALLVSLLRKFWLEPMLVSGPAYLKPVSLALLLFTLLLSIIAFIMFLTSDVG